MDRSLFWLSFGEISGFRKIRGYGDIRGIKKFFIEH